MSNITFRTNITPQDPDIIRDIVTSTGFFREDEIDIAVELAEERLDKGEASGYEFIFMEVDGKTVAYACFGLIPCTKNSYDLYWIATHHDFRNRGLGKQLLKATEEAIKLLKGSGIYVETASRALYTPTRKFYENNGYELKAQFEDYYEEGDDLVYYVKRIC